MPSENSDVSGRQIPKTLTELLVYIYIERIKDPKEGNFLETWIWWSIGAWLAPIAQISKAILKSDNLPSLTLYSKYAIVLMILAVVSLILVYLTKIRKLSQAGLYGIAIGISIIYLGEFLTTENRLPPEKSKTSFQLISTEAMAQARQDITLQPKDILTVNSPAPFGWDGQTQLDQLRVVGLEAQVGKPARETEKGWVFRPPYRSSNWTKPPSDRKITLRAGSLERVTYINTNTACIVGIAENEATFQSIFSGNPVGIWKQIEIFSVMDEKDCDLLNALMTYIYNDEDQSSASFNAINAYSAGKDRIADIISNDINFQIIQNLNSKRLQNFCRVARYQKSISNKIKCLF